MTTSYDRNQDLEIVMEVALRKSLVPEITKRKTNKNLMALKDNPKTHFSII